MRWKDFMHFRKEERIAIILLLILIVVTSTASMLANLMNESRSPLPNPEFTTQFEEFINNLTPTEEAINTNKLNPTQNKKATNITDDTIKKEKQEIINQKQETKSEQNRETTQNNTQQIRIEKFYIGEKIKINEQDTLLWRKVPGIGKSYARRIVKYGNLLGGYTSMKQLREVYGLDEELFFKIEPYIELNDSTRKIEINNFTFKQILSHPYIDYEQTKAIVNERRKRKSFKDIEQIKGLKIFSDDEIRKLSPYLDFSISSE